MLPGTNLFYSQRIISTFVVKLWADSYIIRLLKLWSLKPLHKKVLKKPGDFLVIEKICPPINHINSPYYLVSIVSWRFPTGLNILLIAVRYRIKRIVQAILLVEALAVWVGVPVVLVARAAEVVAAVEASKRRYASFY